MSEERLKEGGTLPHFELQDQSGRTVRSSDLTGKGPFVIYFYPHDETPGCTAQACSFRDAFESFTDAGAAVIGISSDPPDSHMRFAQRHRLPFTLLSDPDGEVRKAFGVPRTLGLLPGRVTYIFDREGVLRHVFDSQMRTSDHVR